MAQRRWVAGGAISIVGGSAIVGTDGRLITANTFISGHTDGMRADGQEDTDIPGGEWVIASKQVCEQERQSEE
jgi:hypothetical protein